MKARRPARPARKPRQSSSRSTTSRSIPAPAANNLWRAPQLPGPTASDIEMPDGINWRFRVRDGEVVEFDDLNLGPQRFVAGEDFGDFVVWRRDGGAQLSACLRGRRRVHGHHRSRARRRSAQVDRAADPALSRAGLRHRPPGFTAGWWWTTTAAAWPSATIRSACTPCASAG